MKLELLETKQHVIVVYNWMEGRGKMLDTWRASRVVSAGEAKSNTTVESDPIQRSKSKRLKIKHQQKLKVKEKKKNV